MENFFQNSSSLDLIEVEELLLFRYTNIDYILNLDISEGIELINKAIEKRQEEKHFTMWTSQLPFMSTENYISFEDYCDKLTGKNIVTKSKEEILREVEEIEQKSKGKGV